MRKAFPFEGNKGPGDKATIVLLQNEISCVDSEGAFSSSTVVQELDGIDVEKKTLKSENSGEGELSNGTTEKRCLVELFEDEEVVEELRVESPARADGPFEAAIETYFAEQNDDFPVLCRDCGLVEPETWKYMVEYTSSKARE